MKLSKKGQRKFDQYKFEYGAYVGNMRDIPPNSFEFEPDDFKGAVVLTVEEAKCLLQGYESLTGLFHALCMHNTFNEMVKFSNKVHERIEQAEEKK